MTVRRLINCLKSEKRISKSVLTDIPHELLDHFSKRLSLYEKNDKRLSISKLINDIQRYKIKQVGGQFTLGKLIGEGAYGKVYQIDDNTVIKIFNDQDKKRICQVYKCINSFLYLFPDIRTPFKDWICSDGSNLFQCNPNIGKVNGYRMNLLTPLEHMPKQIIDKFNTFKEFKKLFLKDTNIDQSVSETGQHSYFFLHGDMKLENILYDGTTNLLYMSDIDTIFCYTKEELNNIINGITHYDLPFDYTVLFAHPLFIALQCFVFPTNKLALDTNVYDCWRMECNIACNYTCVKDADVLLDLIMDFHKIVYAELWNYIKTHETDDPVNAILIYTLNNPDLIFQHMKYFDEYSLGVSLLFHSIINHYTDLQNIATEMIRKTLMMPFHNKFVYKTGGAETDSFRDTIMNKTTEIDNESIKTALQKMNSFKIKHNFEKGQNASDYYKQLLDDAKNNLIECSVNTK